MENLFRSKISQGVVSDKKDPASGGYQWDFWFELSIAETVLTLSFIVLTLVLLKKVQWTLDKQSLVIVMIFICTYIRNNKYP
jgi:hypothetical protein